MFCKSQVGIFLSEKTSSPEITRATIHSLQHTLPRQDQGCQIFLGTLNQNGEKYQNDNNIYQNALKYTK
jgi:hypothetical protein